VAAPFTFEQSLAFSPENAPEILRAIPTLPGVFALHGPPAPEGQAPAQPYLTRAADLRRRITRILAPPDSQSKRLNLRDRVARIDYTVTGSEFESTLALYHAAASIFGLEQARRRLKLRTPFFLRFTAANAYPRVYSTNRLGKRALSTTYGPFPSRAAADRYCDAVLDLFKLRRCVEDLAPYPEHPGCVYQEMKKCLAPCNQACTPAGSAAYAQEAAQVKRFFDTHGESMLAPLAAEREAASTDLDFERAAELHAQWHKVKAAQSLAAEIVQPIPRLRALILQKASLPAAETSSLLSSRSVAEGPASPRILPEELQPSADSPEPEPRDPCSLLPDPCSAVFLLQSGCLTGPARLSTLGVRAVKEQTSVGSSLFAQPLMLEPIPIEDAVATDAPQPSPWLSSRTLSERSEPKGEGPASVDAPTLSPELRAAALIASLEAQASAPTAGAAPTDLATLSDHLSLLRRWYYRPERHRAGEVFFPRAEGSFPKEDSAAASKETVWPVRRILNGAARITLGDPRPMADTNRELVQRNPDQPAATDEAQPARTKVLHAGRPDVERTVPAAPKRTRACNSVTPSTLEAEKHK